LCVFQWEKFDPDDKLSNPSVGYLIFRGAVMLYFVGSTAVNISCSEINYYFIFLTNMTFAIQLIYSVFYFVRLLWVKIERREIEKRLFASNSSNIGFSLQPVLPWPEKIIYALANIALLIPYVVTFGYWVFLYDACKKIAN
jgi:hypothetical protein